MRSRLPVKRTHRDVPTWPRGGAGLLAAVLLILPALVLGGAVPLRRGQPLGAGSIGSVMLLALLVGYLLVARRWFLPWLLSVFA